MAWAISLDGVSNYILAPNYSWSDDLFSLSLRIKINGSTRDDKIVTISEGPSMMFSFRSRSTRFSFFTRVNGSFQASYLAAPFHPTGEYLDVSMTLDNVSGYYEIYYNGVLDSSGTHQTGLSFSSASVFIGSESATSGFIDADIEYIEINGDRRYSATASDHLSLLLTDTISGQDGVLSGGLTTANWLNLGGEEPAEDNVSDIAFDIPAPDFSINATVTAPSVSSDILFSVPVPEFSITVETTVPSVSSDVTFNMPAPEFNIEASVTAPNVISNISFDIPSPEFNISVSVGNDSASNIEFDIPSPEFAVNATVTAPNVNSDVSFNVPAPEFDISVSVGSPDNHSIVEFDVPGPEFSISASITVPTVNSTIEFTIPAPEFRGEESVIIVDDRAIVTYIAKSSVVEYNAETSVIKYNTPTNIVKLR